MIKIIFHRSDLDGHLSGAIARFYMESEENKKINVDFQMIPLDYGDGFDEKKELQKDDVVFFLDFILQPYSRIKWINDNCSLIIADHHEDALKEMETLKVENLFKNKNKHDAACKVTWNMLFDKPVPEFVELISEHDTWDRRDLEKWNDRIEPFQFAMRAEQTLPSTDIGYGFWSKLFNEDCRQFIKDKINIGKEIVKFQKNDFSKIMDDRSFDLEINGLKALCLNVNVKGTQAFESKWDNKKYDLMFGFGMMKNGMWNLGFYSDKDNIDCREVAKKFGGGGHKYAAGAQMDLKDLTKLLGKMKNGNLSKLLGEIK